MVSKFKALFCQCIFIEMHVRNVEKTPINMDLGFEIIARILAI